MQKFAAHDCIFAFLCRWDRGADSSSKLLTMPKKHEERLEVAAGKITGVCWM